MNIRDAKNFINENVTRQITLKDVATYMNYSPYYFSRYFRKSTGETAMEYVRRQRLRAAAEELMCKGSDVCEIALKYCFESQDGFCRAFQRYYGMTPRYYKKYKSEADNNLRHNCEEKDCMNINQIYKEAGCSKEEKMKLLPVIKKLLELSAKTRNEGLFSLENEIEGLESLYFKKALEMLIDGLEPEMIKERLLNYALCGGSTRYELLMRLLIMEGILSIQKGITTYMLRDALVTYLGDDYIEEAYRYFGIDAASQKKARENFILSIKDKRVLSKDCALLECPLSKMDSRSLQRLLREIDPLTLAEAISGSSGAIQEKVLTHMSARWAYIVIEEISGMNEILSLDVTNAQKRVIEIIRLLVEQGDISI